MLLETNPNGQGNWDFSTSGSPVGKEGIYTPKDIEIGNLRIENAQLTFREGKTGSTKRFGLTRFDLARKATGNELTLDLKAEYNGQLVTLSGKTGLLSILFAHHRFPLELSAT